MLVKGDWWGHSGILDQSALISNDSEENSFKTYIMSSHHTAKSSNTAIHLSLIYSGESLWISLYLCVSHSADTNLNLRSGEKKSGKKGEALHLERREADTVTHRHIYCIHTWIYCSVPENMSYSLSPSWRSRSPKKKGTLWEAVNHLCSYALPERVLFMGGLTLSGSPRMYINTSRPGRTLKYFLDHFSLP